MANVTNNYNLNKPLENEKVNISVINQNMDIIDTNLKSLSDEMNEVKENIPSTDGLVSRTTLNATLTDYAKKSELPNEYDDTELSNKVSTIETNLGGHTVKSNVPENAKFTDTVYDDTALKTELTTAITNAKTEVVDTILGEAVDKDFDTLTKVANWILADTTNSAQLITRVTNLESEIDGKADSSDIPTKVSELANDKQYLTSADIDTSQNHTHTNKTVLDKITQDYLDKIDGIAEGAEANVQADWNVTDTTSDAYIKNKPSGAGTNLGLVKSGGDVTISNGVITVKDDSHNHVISNIDNLQSSLDAKVPTSRTVNGKSLSEDITLGASDVGAATPTQVNTVQTNLNTHISDESVHFTETERAKLSGIAEGAQKNTVTGVKGSSESTYRTGNINITKANIGLSNVNNTSDANKPVSTAQQAALDGHNTNVSAHNDIRLLIEDINTKLMNFLDLGTDESAGKEVIDSVSELVNLYEENADLINSITTSKVNVSDIVNNLTTASTSKVLSANQGVEIKKLIDALQTTVNGKSDSDHKHPTDSSRASKTEFDTHTSDTTKHITSTERTSWNSAKTHADSAHAPSNAQANQNAFSNIKVGDTTISADTTTDTLTLVGSNVTITPDTTNDKVTIAVASGSTSTKGVVQLTNSTSSTSTTTAATPNSVKSAYDLANTAKTNAATAQSKADSAYTLAESKVDSLSDLGVTATATELNYMDGVTSNVQTQLNGKAASSHGTHVTYGTTTPKANGTATVGTSSGLARIDHVHPLQTSVSGSSGSCTGNSATATKATQDESGNNIKASYCASASLSGKNLLLKSKSGTTLSTVDLSSLAGTSGAPVYYQSSEPTVTDTSIWIG